MRTKTKITDRTYCPTPYNPAYNSLLQQPNGLQIMNLLWISRDFDKRGITDLSDTAMVKAVVQTMNCSAVTGDRRNPHLHDAAGNVSALLLQPPELFAAWLNKLPADVLVKLPMHQHSGAAWLAKVNQRLPLCTTRFDEVSDVSLAQAALAKFRI